MEFCVEYTYFTQALAHFVYYIPLPYLLLDITVRVRRIVHPHGCVASCRTASGRDAGFTLTTCADCHVATY
jgi:hypothetical protein